MSNRNLSHTPSPSQGGAAGCYFVHAIDDDFVPQVLNGTAKLDEPKLETIVNCIADRIDKAETRYDPMIRF